MTSRDDALQACPFCGFQPLLSDPDCLYPANRERTVWSVHCYQSGGGCGASSLAGSKQDAIDKWNRRALRAAPPSSEPVDSLAAYQEHHFPCADVGIAWNGNRVWVCLDGQALLRAKMMGDKLFVTFSPPEVASPQPTSKEPEPCSIEGMIASERRKEGPK